MTYKKKIIMTQNGKQSQTPHQCSHSYKIFALRWLSIKDFRNSFPAFAFMPYLEDASSPSQIGMPLPQFSFSFLSTQYRLIGVRTYNSKQLRFGNNAKHKRNALKLLTNFATGSSRKLQGQQTEKHANIRRRFFLVAT